jgi:hypothetical protein
MSSDKSNSLKRERVGVMVFNATYFSYIVAVSFIGGGNGSTRRNSPARLKSLINFITFIKEEGPT